MNPSSFRRARRPLAAALVLTAAALVAGKTHAQHAGASMMSGGGGDHQPGSHHMMPPPAGVMGAHMVGEGRVMMMYTPMFMKMDGSRIGTRRVSPETIVTTVPNRFGGVHGTPPTLRIAPEQMSMEMHMLGAMYGITSSINLMVMTSYVEKSMTMITFAGPTGATRRGISEGSTEGIGDTTVALAFKVLEGHGHRVNASLGVSIPTGSIEEEGRMMMPNGMMMQMRSAYGMQLGTGTYDLIPTVTYIGKSGPLGWGVQYSGRIALQDENDERYRWGNQHQVTGWLAYALNEALSGTVRIAASTQGEIDGQDPRIGGPFQGTYPEFYGGERIETFLGLNGHLPLGNGAMARVGIEAGMPIYQRLNGPQLERDWSLAFTAGVHF